MMSPQERIQVLQSAPPNSWLALDANETKIVGQGDSYQVAVEMAERSGEQDPVLIKTPDQWMQMVLWA